jgi:ribose transport system ATP-binding protein
VEIYWTFVVREDNFMKYLIRARGITKIFPGVRALKSVDFDLIEGEIHGIVGKNGAGKSTLVKILAGFLPPDSGVLEINGQIKYALTPEMAIKEGIAYVPQQVPLVPYLSVAENLLFGTWVKNRIGMISWKSIYQIAKERLNNLNINVEPKQIVSDLSLQQRQMIYIARALFSNPRVIILDEPTAPLSRIETDILFKFIRDLNYMGISFIYISHYLNEVLDLCHRITILRDGVRIGTFRTDEIDFDTLIRLISGENINIFKRKKREINGEEIIRVENLTKFPHYQDVSFSVKRGEIVGLTGLEGCGKEVLGKTLFGLEKADCGKIIFMGRAISPGRPSDALALGIGYVPRDRHRWSIIGIRSVLENISLAIINNLKSKFGVIDRKKEVQIVYNLVKILNIVTPTLSQPVEYLSGGNQQKVVIAKLIAKKPKFLILNEPTQGIDVASKNEIMKIIDDLSREGIALLYISEEIDELLEICDRIIVMFNGKICAQFVCGEPETNKENILSAIEGGFRNV